MNEYDFKHNASKGISLPFAVQAPALGWHKVYVRVCVCVCLYVYTHTHTHTHINIHTHTHVYTHTHMLLSRMPMHVTS